MFAAQHDWIKPDYWGPYGITTIAINSQQSPTCNLGGLELEIIAFKWRSIHTHQKHELSYGTVTNNSLIIKHQLTYESGNKEMTRSRDAWHLDVTAFHMY